MRRYDSYKDSGIAWVGEIPEHWELRRNKNCLEECKQEVGKSKDYALLSLTKKGVILRDLESNKGKFPKDFKSYKVVQPNNIIFCLFDIDETPRTVGLSSIYGMITGAYNIFTIKNIVPKYLYFLYESIDDKKGLKPLYTGLRKIIKTDRFLNAKLPFPPLDEQQNIVEFLDEKTAKIDTYIQEKEKEIHSLEELKQAEIAFAVTHGINPDVPMKDSGIAWIGEIPEHWEIRSLRNFLSYVSIKGHGDKQLLSVTRENGVIVRNVESKEENHNFVPDDLSGYKLVEEGQFVINKMKSWQGSYGVSYYTGIVSPAYYVCNLRFENKRFFNIAIRSKSYVPFFTQYSKGIRVDQWDLSPIALKNIPFIVPPLDEQQQIVEYTQQKTAQIDKYISDVKRQIDSLKEYRQRLICDAVTGRINVQPKL
jgi:type I restriction enzyme S subunit